jgi:GT2 family glycosyltransferase/glycosyltransferase involved in cell wall biosynthesis
MLHAGDFTCQLEPLGRFNPHVLPLELLGNADPSRGACLLGIAGKYRVGWDLEEKWRISDTPTGFVEIDPSNGLFELAYSNDGDLRIPVRPQSKYLFSGYFALHRTKSRVILRFFAAGGRLIETIERQIRGEFPGGREAANYDCIELMVTAPPGARHATLVLTYDGAHHPIDWPGYIYFASMSLRPAQSAMACTLIASHPKANLVRLETCQAYRAAVDFVAMSRGRCDLEIRSSDAAYRFYSFQHDARADCELELEGNCVAIDLQGNAATRLYIDNVFCCTRLPARQQGGHCFVVPEKHLDGAIHYVQVRDPHGVEVLGQDFLVFPASLTPWKYLQEECTPPLPNHLAPQAAHRYRSLQAHLADPRLHEDKWLLENLMALHGVLEQGFEKLRSYAPLRFRDCAEPMVSIVIPAKDKVAVTYFCLCALIFAHSKRTFEVILVDDGSSDETQDLPQIVEGLNYIRNETSLGFVRACNRGADVARGEFIVFLNNDTEVTSGWLDELVDAFADHQVGIAGSRLLYPDGLQQEAGGIVWASGNPWNYGRMGNPADPRYSYVRQVDYVSGAALMVSRSAWQAVGGFSDDFAPAYFEDVDLAFKLREHGLKTIYVPHSVVYHHEGLSNGADTNAGMKQYQEVNRPKFKRRWTHLFQGNARDGADVDLEKDRGIKGRVLFIDNNTPRPDIDGGSYAFVQEMRLAHALGYKVTFMAENGSYMGRYTEDLQRLGVEVLYAPFFFSVEEVLARRGAEFDLVYITRYNVAERFIQAVRRLAPRAKLMFNNCDLHFLRELRAGLRTNDRAAIDKALLTREQELSVIRNVDLTLSYNEVEHAVIASHNLDAGRVMRGPWVVYPPESVRGYADRDGIAFLGGYAHPPNLEAMQFFINSVMPLVRRAVPGLALHVYGSQMPQPLLALKQDDVVIGGFVPEVAAVYDRHLIFVAPLLSGAGLKGKVLAAMAHGIPCVLSAIAAEGIGAKSGYEYLRAETPAEWCDAIRRLHSDARLWIEISGNAQQFVRSNYSFEVGLNLMQAAFEEVGLY